MNTIKKVSIFYFSGTGNAKQIALWISEFAEKKGYKIVGQIPFDMPSNWLSIHPSLNEKAIKYLHEKNYIRVQKHSEKIFSNKLDFYAYRDLVQDILIAPISLGYYCIGRFALAKSFYASADCDLCGSCTKHCPVKAIKIVNNHPFWSFNCESCMHSMNSCPKRAIESAHGLMAIVAILSSFSFSIFLHHILQLDIESSLIRFTLWSVIFVILLSILYYLQHLLLKYKIMSKLITMTSLTHSKFWGRYTSIPDKKWKP